MPIRGLAELWKSLLYIIRHPLNRENRVSALYRWLRWQVSIRITSGEYLFKLVNETRIIARRGMTGATGCIYCGLDEYSEMAFVLHALRAGDLFVDCGANIGVYTLLASSTKASCVSFEPVADTFITLRRNVALNELGESVVLWNMALGREPGRLAFTTGMDTINHVVHGTDSFSKAVEVPVASLDQMLSGQHPLIIKIDVEGYETAVITGAKEILAGNEPMAIVIELRGHGRRYGFDEDELHQYFLSLGFKNCIYNPMQRSLAVSEDTFGRTDRIYCRDVEFFSKRVLLAAQYQLSNQLL